MKNKSMLKKLWVKLTVALMLTQLFVPSITALADGVNIAPQEATTQEIKKESVVDDGKNETDPVTVSDVTENKDSEDKNSQTTVGENQNANDSPIVEKELPVFEVIEPSTKLITFNENGTPMLDGEAFYKNEEQITKEDLVELMKQGGNAQSDGSKVLARSVRANVTIEYLGQVTYGYNIVGHFRVNGEDAFCIEHSKPTPPTGTPADDGLIYNDVNVRSALYYGWNGSENIFTDFAMGYTATSLVVSYYYTGVASGINTPEAQALMNKVASNPVPNPSASFSTINPTVSMVNGQQRTENITLNADSRNVFKLPIPAGMTFNLVGGGTQTNTTVNIKGGDTFFLTADMRYTNNYATGALQGSMKKWQAVLTKPNDSSLQTLGRGGWFDPDFTLQFKADFFARLGDVTINKADSETGKTPQGDASLNGAVYRVKDSAGTTKDVTIANNTAIAKDMLIGNVTIQEITPPTGYLLDPTVYTVDLDYNNTTGKIEVTKEVKENVIKGNVDIMKYYSLVEGSAILLPEKGAGFSIYLKSSGKLVQTQETNALGHATFTGLPYGVYTVKQTKSPAGTLPVADFEVNVNENGQTYFYNILNGKFKSPTKLIKVDSVTGKNVLVPGTVFKIKDLETGLWVTQTTHNITEFVTDKNGEVLLFDELRFGDYELYEVKAPRGYVINKTPQKFSVNQESQNNGMIIVKFANKAQKGKVTLNKTGEVATSSKITDTEFGKQYDFEYSQKPLAGSEFNVIATKDIVTGDGTMYHKKGDIAGTATTDNSGKLVISNLNLGSYALVETKASKGYVLDGKEYPFELTYAGQEVEVTTAQVSVKNVLQDLNIKINKTEESAKWVDGKAVIEEIPSNGKVFGVFSNQDFSYNGKVIVPSKSLVGVATTKAGIAEIQQKYPQGKFFVKELDAGKDHVINPNEFEFEFTAQDNKKTLEIGIWGDSVAYGKQNLLKIARNPITNELGKINVKLLKVDNELSLTQDTPLAGVEYDLILKKEGKKEIVSHYVTDNKGEINVENIPSGDYEFVETKALTDYILDTKPIEFESKPETNGDSIVFKAVNKHMPASLGTYASGINGQKLFNPRIENVVFDDMDFEFAYAGIDIFLTTILMEKGATPAQDKEVLRKETTFKTTGTKFKTQVGLTIPANTMDGNKDYYFVEVANRDEARKIIYVKHDDRDDKGQTIRSEVPKIETLFAGLKGEKDFNPKKDNTIVDKVNATNFEANHEFTIVTEYVNPKTLEVVSVDEQQKIFSEKDSTFDVLLNLPANKMKSGEKLVATHKVYYDKEKTILYAEHYDLGNLKQTVTFTAPKVVVLPQTGEVVSTFALIGALLIGLVAVGFAVRSNRMKKEKNKLMEKVALYGFGGEQSIFSETEDQVECEVATLLVEGIIETGSKVGLENEKAIRLLEKVEQAYLTSTARNTVLKPVEQL